MIAGTKPGKNNTPQPGGNGFQLNAPRVGGNGFHLNHPLDWDTTDSTRTLRTLRTLSDLDDLEGPKGTMTRVARGDVCGADANAHTPDTPDAPDAPTPHEMMAMEWEQFLLAAYEENQSHLADVEDDDERRWQGETRIFWFTHLVWSRPDLGPDAHQPARLFTKIEASLKRWSAECKRTKEEPPHGFTGDAWEEWFGISRDEAKTEFLTLWAKFRHPVGQSPLEAALMLARRQSLGLSPEVCQRRGIETARDRPDGYLLFVSLAGHLQTILGGQPIYLPQEVLAKLLRVSARTISSWRSWAVEDGYLVQVSAPGRRSPGRYRFDVSRWKVLEKKSPQGTGEGFAP